MWIILVSICKAFPELALSAATFLFFASPYSVNDRIKSLNQTGKSYVSIYIMAIKGEK